MDEKQFAEISKAISKETTRRGALARFAGGLAAALVGSRLVTSDVEAKRKKRGKKGGKAKATASPRSTGKTASRIAAEACDACSPFTVEKVDGNPDQCKDNRVTPGDGAETGIFTADCGCQIAWEITVTDSGVEVLSFGPVKDDEGNIIAPVCTVAQFIAKGGNAANIYTFTPATTCAEGLVTPENASGDPAGFSHFDFCGAECCDPLTCGDFECTNASQCDGCGGVLPPCVCESDDKACTTDTCVVPDGEVAGTCQYVQKDCSGEENACNTNCRCEEPSGNCVCDPVECPEEPGCINTGCDPVEGCQYDCRCQSCTIGFYSQNQCRWDTSLELPCAADSAIGSKCYGNYGKTLKGLLTARGRDVICAQAAAAYLNSLLGVNNCTESIPNICSATNAQLTAANEGFGNETCPLRGCGNS
jgi:hypothetical protein